MREQLEKRTTELEAEYRAGQQMLAELDAKRTDLQQTLLRISGAIQVLKELLEADRDVAGDDAGSAQPSTPPPRQDADLPSSGLIGG